MPSVPTPIRVLLGVAVTAAEEARKLPDALPNLATTVPMVAVSTAMQASMRVQQQLASLAAKGDEVLAQLRTSDDAPPWATFDDPPAESAPSGADTSAAAGASAHAKPAAAAFDRIDFDQTGFTEGQQSDPDGWDAIGTADSVDVIESDSGSAPPTTKPAARKATKQTTKKNSAVREKATAKATPKKATPRKSVAKSAAPKTTEPDSSDAPDAG